MNKIRFLIGSALFSLLIGYSAELSSFYFQMLRPATFRVLRPVHEYRQNCDLPAVLGAYCSDLYVIPIQEVLAGLDRTLGIGMFAGDLKFGCFDTRSFQEQIRFGNPDRPGHLSNPYREFRSFPLDTLSCTESVAIAVFPRVQDARHGHVAGRFVVGQSEDMHDFRKLLDFLQNQLLVAGSLLCLMLFMTGQSFLRTFSNSEDHRDLYVAMVYVTASCVLTSGLAQCLFPLSENQIFFRKIVSFSDLLSEFVLWRYMLRNRKSVFLAPLNRILKPPFTIKNDLLEILLSPVSVTIFIIFCFPIWSKAFVYTTCVVSFLIFFAAFTSPIELSIYGFILVFTKLKLLNLTYMPQSSTATYYMGLYVAYEVFRTVNLEIRNVIYQLISKSTNDRVFTQQVLHDIKSPIGVLRILLSQIKWDESQAEVKEAILGSVGRIQSLSRAASATSFEGERADLSFIPNMIREFEIARQGRIAYCAQADGEAKVSIRQSTLIRIVQNLITNSTEADGVTLISVHGQRQHLSYRLEVANDGATIPHAILHQILASGGTYAKEGGSGVGVQFCKNEVERAGGRFEMTSENGQTRVVIELPLARN